MPRGSQRPLLGSGGANGGLSGDDDEAKHAPPVQQQQQQHPQHVQLAQQVHHAQHNAQQAQHASPQAHHHNSLAAPAGPDNNPFRPLDQRVFDGGNAFFPAAAAPAVPVGVTPPGVTPAGGGVGVTPGGVTQGVTVNDTRHGNTVTGNDTVTGANVPAQQLHHQQQRAISQQPQPLQLRHPAHGLHHPGADPNQAQNQTQPQNQPQNQGQTGSQGRSHRRGSAVSQQGAQASVSVSTSSKRGQTDTSTTQKPGKEDSKAGGARKDRLVQTTKLAGGGSPSPFRRFAHINPWTPGALVMLFPCVVLVVLFLALDTSTGGPRRTPLEPHTAPVCWSGDALEVDGTLTRNTFRLDQCEEPAQQRDVATQCFLRITDDRCTTGRRLFVGGCHHPELPHPEMPEDQAECSPSDGLPGCGLGPWTACCAEDHCNWDGLAGGGDHTELLPSPHSLRTFQVPASHPSQLTQLVVSVNGRLPGSGQPGDCLTLVWSVPVEFAEDLRTPNRSWCYAGRELAWQEQPSPTTGSASTSFSAATSAAQSSSQSLTTASIGGSQQNTHKISQTPQFTAQTASTSSSEPLLPPPFPSGAVLGVWTRIDASTGRVECQPVRDHVRILGLHGCFAFAYGPGRNLSDSAMDAAVTLLAEPGRAKGLGWNWGSLPEFSGTTGFDAASVTGHSTVRSGLGTPLLHLAPHVSNKAGKAQGRGDGTQPEVAEQETKAERDVMVMSGSANGGSSNRRSRGGASREL